MKPKPEKTATPTDTQRPPMGDSTVTRDYFNSSGLDYMEYKETVCKCGRHFRASRMVWDGHAHGELEDVCSKCERDAKLAEERAFTIDLRSGRIPQLQPELTPYPLPPERDAQSGPFPEDWLKMHEINDWHQSHLLPRLTTCTLGGDEEAALMLFRHTWECVMALDFVARHRPEMLRRFSRKEVMWPGFIGKGEKRKKGSNADRLITSLELGQASIYRGTWHLKAPSTNAVVTMEGWLKQNQHLLQLPPLTSKTRSIWFEKGWEGLMKSVDDRPDQNPYYANIGKSAIRRPKEGKGDRRGMPEQTEGMKRDDVIARIKGLVWKSFCTYTKHAPAH